MSISKLAKGAHLAAAEPKFDHRIVLKSMPCPSPIGLGIRAFIGFSTDAADPSLIDHPGASLIATKDAILKIRRLLLDLNLCAALKTIEASLGCLLSARLTDNARKFEITVRALHGHLPSPLGSSRRFPAFSEIFPRLVGSCSRLLGIS
jgi:hypothetical protein